MNKTKPNTTLSLFVPWYAAVTVVRADAQRRPL